MSDEQIPTDPASGSETVPDGADSGTEPPAPDVSGPTDQEPPAPLPDPPLEGAEIVTVGPAVEVIERDDLEGPSTRPGSGDRDLGRPGTFGRPRRPGSGAPPA